jgi:subtilisin family serine protease
MEGKMPSSEIDQTIAAVGYAKVIVTLTSPAAAAERDPQTRGVAALAGQEGTALENHFIVPSEVQMESLAATARNAASRSFQRPEALQSRRVRVFPHLGLAIGYVDAAGAVALEASTAVARVEKAPELSLIKPVAIRPIKPKKVVSWGVARIGIERLWAAGYDGTGVVVGHLDTGVDGSHPALKGAIADFAEFDMAGDKVPGAKAHDSGDHGTHTAGTIVGRAGPKGSFGVAPGAKIASGLVIEGGQVIDRILSGMDWIIESGCRILSMSLGLRGFTPAFEQIIDALRNAGVLPIIAVGNEGPMTSRSPGNYDTVLSVGAMDDTDHVADFSGSQKFNRQADPLVPDLVAPGVGVVSCVPGNGFAEMDGSSMATPHVAGLAAVLLQAMPGATVAQLEQAIIGSCRRPASMPAGRANRGVPDAARAFKLLTGTNVPAPAEAKKARRSKVARPASRTAKSRQPSMPVSTKKAAGGRTKK